MEDSKDTTVTPSAPGPRMILTTLRMYQSPSAMDLSVSDAAKAKYVVQWRVLDDTCTRPSRWYNKEVPVNPFTPTLLVTLESMELSSVYVEIYYRSPENNHSDIVQFSFTTLGFVPPLPPGFIDSQIHISHVEDAANFPHLKLVSTPHDSPAVTTPPVEVPVVASGDELSPSIEGEKDLYVWATGLGSPTPPDMVYGVPGDDETIGRIMDFKTREDVAIVVPSDLSEFGGDTTKTVNILTGFYAYEEIGYTPDDHISSPDVQVIHGQS